MSAMPINVMDELGLGLVTLRSPRVLFCLLQRRNHAGRLCLGVSIPCQQSQPTRGCSLTLLTQQSTSQMYR